MSEETKALVRRWFEEGWNKGNVDAAGEFFSPSYVMHAAGGDQSGLPGRGVARYRAGFPDLTLSVADQIAEGDRVVTRFTFSGTHQGQFEGIAPTGNHVSVSGMFIHRFAGDKIVEGWASVDRLGIMQQIGAIPSQ